MRGENRCKIHSCFIGKDGCKICNEIAELNLIITDQEQEISELTLGIDETDSFKSMNVEEINALRGFAAAATFQHDCLIKWQECHKFKPSKSKEKLIKQLERQRAENLKMLGVLNADFSEKNWEQANGLEELESFKASAERHFRQAMSGDTTEDHFAAVLFNLNGIVYLMDKLKCDVKGNKNEN